MTPALIVALPFLGALLAGLAARIGRGASAFASGAITALALIGLCLHAPAVLDGAVIQSRAAWLPRIGLEAAFFLDGLGLLFAGLILGMGLLIQLYAHFYLSPRDPAGRFFSFLMLFQGAMLGIVLSDNILLLLVFWELTSLASFLLIGYWQDRPEARAGARMALAVTGGGGLALIAGMLLLGMAAGSHDLSIILRSGEAVRESPLCLPAMALILIGCFAKSAQFPFQFWLPRAMAAPTPVSAYLHSATMVKAGIFLMARLWPVLAERPEWFWAVTLTGLATLLIGAVAALFQDDLKALLACSTVSHLGLVTMLLGFATREAALAAVVHILNHAVFKAALFMMAGIVDHETGSRDLRRLGGLARAMPATFTIASVAGLSMAGLPPFGGFLSKELMLEQVAGLGRWPILALVTLAAAVSVAYALRLIGGTFLGPRQAAETAAHDPGPGLWAAPALLALLTLLAGLLPMALMGGLADAAAGAVTGAPVHAHLALWHGAESPALWLSLAAVGGGVVLLGLRGRLDRLRAALPRPDAARGFEALLAGLTATARAFDRALHGGQLSRALWPMLAALLATGWAAFRLAPHLPGSRALQPVEPVAALAWAALVAGSLTIALRHRQRLLALILVGVVGLIVSLGFAYLSAPDLALTQISVEVVTVALMLLALNFLPKETQAERRLPRARDALLAGATGLAVAALAYALMTRDFAFPSIAAYHLANAKTLGGGTNVVNVILVDFRGYDTFGEITVLGIAATLIFALTSTLLSPGPADRRLARWQNARDAGDRHPLLMVVVTRLMLPLALMVGIYIFLRGHNMPGGGFIAGLVVAIALVMQYMASGFGWTEARQRIDYHGLIGAGLVIAAATGVGSWLAGRPFMTSAYGYVHLWPLEEIELASAALFDLGVFLTVLGAVMLALSSLTRIARRAGQVVNREAFDMEDQFDGEAR